MVQLPKIRGRLCFFVALAAALPAEPLRAAVGPASAFAEPAGVSVALIRTHQLIFVGVASALALLHLALFTFRPRHVENLYCGLFLGCFAVLIYANFVLALIEDARDLDLTFRLFLAMTGAVAITSVLTIHAVFAAKPPIASNYYGAAACAVIVYGLLRANAASYWTVIGFAGISGIEVIRCILLAHRNRRRGTWIIGAGMVILVLALSYNIMRSLGWLPTRPWSMFVIAYAGLAIALTMSLFVARTFAYLATELELKLAEVRRLSDLTLSQEQEKQRLIVSKNAELEEMVAHRTRELLLEKEKADALLFNVLPREAAEELKLHGRATPRRFDDITILFTDFKGFTNTVSAMPAARLVTELNDMFHQFDDIVEENGLEKIKTIGDAYMAAAGLPVSPPDSARRAVATALAMIACVARRNERSAVKWHMRAGIHTGAVAGGVVGKRRFVFDLFGDTVNIASRMETQSEPGRVTMSAYTYDLVRDSYACEYRGKVDIKGKGEIDIYSVGS